MKDYTKVCWNCGSTKVFPVQTWFKCDDCGATHVPQPIPFHGDLIEATKGGMATEDNPLGSHYSPSKKVAQEAAKARRAKSKVV